MQQRLFCVKTGTTYLGRESMKRKILRTIAAGCFALAALLSAAWPGQTQDAKTPYPSMAPVEQYMMERNAEIALARSAAPESISRDAEVLVLGRHGYETAAKGNNGIVIFGKRLCSWVIDVPNFWNPMMLGVICYNQPGERSYCL